MPYKGKRSNRPRANKTRKARKPTAKPSAPLRNYIAKAISIKKQNRQLITTGLNGAINTVLAGNAPTTFVNLMPQPTRQVNDDGRIGNALTIKQGIIRGHVNLLSYNSVTNPVVAPMYVKMWVVSCKQNNTSVLADTNIATNFFDGNSAPLGFQQNMLDLHLPPCKENWVLHYSKIIKLGLGSGTNAYPSTTTQVNDNSSFTAPFYFNWGRKCKTVLKYLDSSAYPMNRNMWLIFTAVSADGQSTSITPAEYHYVNKTVFEC